jgi:hypothetical protein
MVGKMFSDLFADPWLLAASIAQLLLILLGAVVTLQEEWVKQHKKLLLVAFAVLGCAGFIATAKQGGESAATNAKLADTLGQLSTATTGISRMTALNTELQNRLLQQSDIIIDLSKQNISTVTGGDSFCYVSFSPIPSQGVLVVMAVHKGKFPLHSVEVAIDDLRVSESAPLGVLIQLPEYRFTIPELAPNTSKVLGNIPLGNLERQSLNVNFYGLAGYWTEMIRAVFGKNGQWLEAIQVQRAGPRQGILFEQIPDSFPKREGKVVW